MPDSILHSLTAATDLLTTDLLYLERDPAGSPLDRKISGQDLLKGAASGLCTGRLTLISDTPVYAPQPRTPSATDTTADTVDFAAAHGWATGTVATISATVGGLTITTTYYLRAVDADTVSFHTTYADAVANTNKVNLTASITAEVIPSGVTSSNIYYTPTILGDRISVLDGAGVPTLINFTQASLALSGLTSGRLYDVFGYLNAGALALELSAAWNADGVTRTDALTTIGGLLYKSGATTRRYLGTIRTTGATTTEDTGFGSTSAAPKRFVWNAYNQVWLPVFIEEDTASWTYTGSTAWRQARAQSDNQIEVVVGLPGRGGIRLSILGPVSTSAASSASIYGIGRDSTSALAAHQVNYYTGSTGAGVVIPASAVLSEFVPVGYHYYTWLETITSSGITGTFYGTAVASRRVGLLGEILG